MGNKTSFGGSIRDSTSHSIVASNYNTKKLTELQTTQQATGVDHFNNPNLAIINQEINEVSIINGDDIEGMQMAANTERSAVKVSMIRMNNEIIYQNGQLMYQ